MNSLSGTDKVFAILRIISVIGGISWVKLNPIYSQEIFLYLIFAFFILYSLILIKFVIDRPNCSFKYYRFSLVFDFIFIIFLIKYTGGLTSHFYFAFYILASLYTFYYGIRFGLSIATLGTCTYLIIGHNQFNRVYFGDVSLQIAFLYMVTLSIGYLNYQLKMSNRRIESNLSQITQIYRVTQSVSSTLEIDKVLELILQSSAEITGAINGAIILLEKDGSYNKVVNYGNGLSGMQIKKDFIINKVIKEGIPYTTSVINGSRKLYVYPQMVVPIIIKEKAIGIILLEGKVKGKDFRKDDIALINTFASNAAVALENAKLFNETNEQAIEKAKLYEDMKEMYYNIIQGFVAAIDAKDTYTRGHSEQVTIYANAIAERLMLSKAQVDLISNAALLHDIGKIGIDESILKKPSRLNDVEYDRIKTHPYIGAQILSEVESLKDVIPIIYHHHERYDGNGYIDGLSKGQVPIGARIIAVADAFEAMTSDRPYRPALSTQEALKELHACSGTQFDPEIVKIFAEIVKEKGNRLKLVI